MTKRITELCVCKEEFCVLKMFTDWQVYLNIFK